MRILIAGTFCSGKTTLVNDLARKIDTAVVVADECRPLLDSFSQVNWANPAVRSYLWVRQVLVERQACESAQDQVIDGGIITNLAHDKALLEPLLDHSALLDEFEFPRYDRVFICNPSDVEIVDDGQRYTDSRLRALIHSLVIESVAELGYSSDLLSGTPHERLNQVLGAVT